MVIVAAAIWTSEGGTNSVSQLGPSLRPDTTAWKLPLADRRNVSDSLNADAGIDTSSRRASTARFAKVTAKRRRAYMTFSG
jgi:hypothetical protein